MRISKIVTLAGVSLALSATANAQFSVSGAGSAIPASGTGGDALVAGDGGASYDTVQAGPAGSSTVVVANAVTSITSIDIQGLAHSWSGDVQATLSDPNGVEHLIFLRPGYLNTSNFGNSGDFDGGDYTFVGDGSGAAIPNSSGAGNIVAGTYNQSFDSGGTVWVDGTNGIFNTAMGSITGPAGNWSLNLYDWGGGDSGSFTGWTLNGTEAGGPNSGSPYCSGDGTGAACPCSAVGGTDAGCPNSVGTGALLIGSGEADTAAGMDTFLLTVTGLPVHNMGVFFQGTNAVAAPFGEGILCINPIGRYAPAFSDPSGTASLAGGGAGGTIGGNATLGVPMLYSYWYRDGANGCAGSGFNFANGWTVSWL